MTVTFRDRVRAELDALKTNRTTCLGDVVAMSVLYASLLLAVTSGDHARARELLAKLVALGSLVAEYPEVRDAPEPTPQAPPPTAPAPFSPFSDDPLWTLDTWASQLAAIDRTTTAEEVGRTWVRHAPVLAKKGSPLSPETAWTDLRKKVADTGIKFSAVVQHIEHLGGRVPR